MSAESLPVIGNLLAHALEYAAQGLEIFPVDPATKRPMAAVAHGAPSQYSATTDADQILAWWTRWPDALIGHRLGEDVLVIDIDPRHGGNATWHLFREVHGIPKPTTRSHVSGRGDGGGHLWFQRPAGKLTISKFDAWAEEHGTGHHVANADRWVCGLDLLHRTHRYTILPPSPHPTTGDPYRWNIWGDIEAAHEAVAAILVDTSPPPAPYTPKPYNGDSIADWYSAKYGVADLLHRHGWALRQGDGDSDGSAWQHPHATSPVSATVRNGCLFVYTPNTPFEVTAPGSPKGITPFKALTILEHGGDGSAAGKAARILKDGERIKATPAPEFRPPPNVNPDTGEIDDTEPDTPDADLGANEEFWNANETLAHIRQAARARRVSPTAALGAVLARVAAFTPPSRRIPPFVGGAVPLSLYVALVAGTSGGKSTVASVATELLPTVPSGVVGPLPLGSGEGLTDAYLETVTEKDDSNKTVTRKKQTRTGVLFTLDEGRALADMAKRSGTTIVSALCTAWTGGDLGQANASVETFRHVKAGGYACGVVSLWQPTLMGGLFEETDSGLAGRMLYLPTTDADAPDHAPDWPGTLDWEPPTHVAFGGELRYDPAIRREVDADHLARIRGELVPHPLDGHRNLHRLKIAGLLAVLDGRSDVTTDDWTLATLILTSSDALRTSIKATLDYVATAARQARIHHDVERAAAIEQSAEQRALEAGARAMARRVHKVGEGATKRDLTHAVASKHRKLASVDEMIAAAVGHGWIAPSAVGGEEVYEPGGSRPS